MSTPKIDRLPQSDEIAGIINGMEALQSELGERLKHNFLLAPYLTLKTKTRAEYYVEVRSRAEFIKVVSLAQKEKIPYFILGGGSNLAILSEQIPGLTIHNRYSHKEIVGETDTTIDLLVSSGYSMTRLAKETAESGWSGLEYQLGLPGTVGGAVVMNSKWMKHRQFVGDAVRSVTVINQNGEEQTMWAGELDFAYGWSNLQESKIPVVDIVFTLKKTSPDELIAHGKEALAYRKATQPFGVATSGCFFKNLTFEEAQIDDLPTTSAGHVIDQAGLKGERRGPFVVSDIHANFIVNTKEDGDPQDLLALIKHIRTTIRETYGIELRDEVIVM